MKSILRIFFSLIFLLPIIGFGLTKAQYQQQIEQKLNTISAKYTDDKKLVQDLINLKSRLWILKRKYSTAGQQKIDIIIQIINIKIYEVGLISSKVDYGFTNIDMTKVKSTRISRYNYTRKNLGLSSLSYHPNLDYSAQARADSLNARYGTLSPNFNDIHKRNLSDSYYDYTKIESRMVNHWVIAKNVNRVTFTENVWYGYIKCPKLWDCTQQAIDWIKTTFDFFIAEKKTNGAHYKSIINKEFKYIGMWLTINSKGQYRIVAHYFTEPANN